MSTLDGNGLIIDDLNDIITNLETGLKDIYGSDIVLDSNSPDGQAVNIFSQAIADLQEVLLRIYNGFDLDSAIGVQLDRLAPLIATTRQGSTFSLQQVNITTDRSLTLQGLDAAANDIDGTGYTIADNSGNQFILLDTTTIPAAGTYLLTFRAKELGSITTIPNTITNPVSVILGVIGIDNPSGVLEIGKDGELDSQFRARLKSSPANRAKGSTDSILGSLLNVSNTTDAKVYENFTATIDSNAIPAHSIWAIVEGGANTDIAQVLYNTKSTGCGLKGSVVVDILKDNGEIFQAKFDRPLSKNLWIQFDLKLTTAAVFDSAALKQYLVDNLTFSIGESAETSKVVYSAVSGIVEQGGGAVALNVKISNDGVSYVDFLAVDTIQEKWIVDLARITINEI